MLFWLIRPPRATTLALCAGAIATVAGGCAAFRSLAGRNTIDLEGAEVRSMGVDIRKQEKTICPRERVQMAVFADVVLKGDQQVKKVETWAGGSSTNRNGKLDFTEFAFQSTLGRFDELGWFSPNPDVTASAAKEIEIKTVFRRRPDKFTFSTTYKPDYRCIHELGENAGSGAGGQSGPAGNAGESGATGSSDAAGGNAGDGGPGGPGGSGGQGANGVRLLAYATLVKTPFYDKLVAIAVDGGPHGGDFVLAHLEGKLTILARGGDGAPGGNGGRGGDGGNGGSGNPGGNGGNGAQGGNGGNGGNGGSGGNIDLIFDERFPELRELIQLDVAGGAAGPGGAGGGGGNAGHGGSGMNNGASGSDGRGGNGGAGGAQGSPGPTGTANKQAGQAGDKFAGRTGITVL